MNELALFAGAGGGILGGKLLGWRTVCAVEWEAYAASVLCARQNDGALPAFPIWDDVRTFDGRPWCGIVDVVSGGFPCQDISVAGKRTGIVGERSGIWREMARIISEVRPRFVWVENSPMLVGRGLGLVLFDLATLGFDARWGIVGANDIGAPHNRERIWIRGSNVSNSKHIGFDRNGQDEHQRQRQEMGGDQQFGRNGSNRQMAHPNDAGCGKQRVSITNETENETLERRSWWSIEPDVGRVAHGVALRVDRLRALGNGQVPAVAALAWSKLSTLK